MMNENDKKNSVVDSDNPNDSSTSASGPIGHAPADLAKLLEKRRQREAEKAAKPKRGRPRKKQAQVEISHDEAQAILGPIFLVTSSILESRGVEPLSQEEIQNGVNAWYPVLNKYMPVLGEHSVWIPAVMWTGGVIAVRALPENDTDTKEKEALKKPFPKVVKND
jgi:hypothetical protein